MFVRSNTSPLAPSRCPSGQPVSSWSLAPLDEQAWDLLVIGGAAAGIVGAETAAGLGAGVLLVERARTGGDCLWTGCVPNKALLAAAQAAAAARGAAGCARSTS